MTMRSAGFAQINFGSELTNADKAQALSLNSARDRHRRGLPLEAPVVVPLSRGGQHWRRLSSRDGVAGGRGASRDQGLHARWKKMARFGMCALDQDPSHLFANSSPSPRPHVWRDEEAVRLVKCAWRQGYHGLAALLAVTWGSQLSPVDARSLTGDQWRRDPVGTWFELDRAKTSRPAVATLSRRTQQLLAAYLSQLSAEPIGFTPTFRNRSYRPYSKDKLGDDFRAVRHGLFGGDEKRQLADFRRSGSVEALAGSIEPEKLSSRMANSLSTSNRLHKTYGPVQLSSVRDADEARQKGSAKLRAVQVSGEQRSTKIPGSLRESSRTRISSLLSH